jgi:uncharacterized membrane protein
MSNLIVLTFDDTQQASQAFDALKKAHGSGLVDIDDAAVIVKQESGKVEIKNQMDKATKWGAVGGGMLGLLLASVFFPVAGILIGALGGGLIGKSLNMGVDQKFVKEVTGTLKPGSSALFVIGSGNPDAISAVFRPFKGTIYQTTLSSEDVETLQDALKKKE